jgi:hypothetical protein
VRSAIFLSFWIITGLRYARTHGTGIIIYVNSATRHKHRLHHVISRRSLLRLSGRRAQDEGCRVGWRSIAVCAHMIPC